MPGLAPAPRPLCRLVPAVAARRVDSSGLALWAPVPASRAPPRRPDRAAAAVSPGVPAPGVVRRPARRAIAPVPALRPLRCLALLRLWSLCRPACPAARFRVCPATSRLDVAEHPLPLSADAGSHSSLYLICPARPPLRLPAVALRLPLAFARPACAKSVQNRAVFGLDGARTPLPIRGNAGEGSTI